MCAAKILQRSNDLATHFFRESQNPALAEDVFKFRKRVLVDEYAWQLSVDGAIERDEFDTEQTIHCAIVRTGRLIGAFRAIRSDLPYLSAIKFPELAQSTPYPRNTLTWEISRLTVAPGERRFDTSLMVYAAMFHFLQLKGGKSIVGFCDVAHQRLLERVGIETRPYGPAAQIGCDGMGRPLTVVAGEMPLPKSPSLRFRKLMSRIDNMEIYDDTSLLGHSSLSA